MRLFYLAYTLMGLIFCSASYSSSLEDNIEPSNSSAPVRQSFFHRTKAQSPVFIECTTTFILPHELVRNFTIRLWEGEPADPETPEQTKIHLQQSLSIGFLSVTISQPSVDLTTIQILPQYRRLGYGTHALLTLFSLYNSRESLSFQLFTLSIRNDDQKDQLFRFYHNLGFQVARPPSFLKMADDPILISLNMVRAHFDLKKVIVKTPPALKEIGHSAQKAA